MLLLLVTSRDMIVPTNCLITKIKTGSLIALVLQLRGFPYSRRTTGLQIAMNTVLLILGVLGLGAVIISAYVFTVAARNYVSDDVQGDENTSPTSLSSKYILRGQSDRRQLSMVSFPITVNGITIDEDRRKLSDRRLVA